MRATLRCFTNALDDLPSAVHKFNGPPKEVAEQLWKTISAFTGRSIEFDLNPVDSDEQAEFNAAYQALVPDNAHADHGWASTDVTQ